MRQIIHSFIHSFIAWGSQVMFSDTGNILIPRASFQEVVSMLPGQLWLWGGSSPTWQNLLFSFSDMVFHLSAHFFWKSANTTTSSGNLRLYSSRHVCKMIVKREFHKCFKSLRVPTHTWTKKAYAVMTPLGRLSSRAGCPASPPWGRPRGILESICGIFWKSLRIRREIIKYVKDEERVWADGVSD